MKYVIRYGIGVSADVAGNELARINAERGGVTPALVVDEARPNDAPLHPAFTWDNAKAAELYRLDEARNLIRAVHIQEDDGTDKGSAFVRVDVVDQPGVYLPVAQVVADPDLFASAVRALVDKLEQAKRSLIDLEAASGNQKRKGAVQKARRSIEKATGTLGSVV